MVVVDADGRLDPTALDQVLPVFDDRRIGGVQIGVRINNRRASLLARMQDIEFVLYTNIFLRGRRHLGSVGLGGTASSSGFRPCALWVAHRGPEASRRTSTSG